MKNILTTLSIPLVISIFTIDARADAPPPTIDAAIATASAAHKPLLLEFSTTWCGACTDFAKTVLPSQKVHAALGEVVFVHYDAEVGPGIDAARKYNVTGFPTFIAVDAQGVARLRTLGAPSGDSGITAFIELITEANSATLDETAMRAGLIAKNKDAATLLASARWFIAHDREREALPLLDQVVSDKSTSQIMRATAWRLVTEKRRVATWKHQLAAEAAEDVMRDPNSATMQQLTIATLHSDLTPEIIQFVFKQFVAGRTDAESLNSMAYLALAANQPKQALAAAAKATASQPTAPYLDTLAECHHALGDHAEAIQIEDRAIAMATAKPISATVVDGLRSNRARFVSGVGEADEVKARRAQPGTDLRIIDLGDASDQPSPPPSSQTVMMTFWADAKKWQDGIVAQCRAVATATDLAYVREIPDETGHFKHVLLLPINVSGKLHDCLDAALDASAPPAPPMGFAKVRTYDLDFGPADPM